MKKILLVLLMTTFLSQLSGQNIHEVTFPGPVSFPKLFKAGDAHVTILGSMNDTLSTATQNFSQAVIGKISDCKLTIKTSVDTIRLITVETSSSEKSKQLVEQAIKDYGKPTETNTKNGLTIYIWKAGFNDKHNIVSTLTINTLNSTGFLEGKIE